MVCSLALGFLIRKTKAATGMDENFASSGANGVNAVISTSTGSSLSR